MTTRVSLTVDGHQRQIEIEDRTLLIQGLRDVLGITGPHIGCESGRCGACTVIMDGHAVKSCMVLATQAEGATITTAATISRDPHGAALQQAFHRHHALQCGYCTPGMLSAAVDLLRSDPTPTEEAVRQALRGNLCRCTGYQHIVDAVLHAAEALRPNEGVPA
jgi:carbon-monoxide dehydrogenase small subunit